MRSISIHGLEDRLYQRIKRKADLEGTSMNKTIKRLLRESLGLSGRISRNHREDFMDIFGFWNHIDEQEFNRSAGDFESIDRGDWQ
jgi:hypothetical protein